MSDQGDEVQWELITPESHPERLDVLDYIARRPQESAIAPRYRHTGRRFFRRIQQCPALAEMVITGLRMGMSVRLLALRIGVAPKTLAAARRLLTERGELPPVRRRVDRLLDEVVEEGLEYTLEGIRSGRTHPGQIPIPALAALDKMTQRDAGIVLGTERTHEETALARLQAAASVLGLVAGAEPAAVDVTDSASASHTAISAVSSAASALDTGADTAGDLERGGDLGPDGGPVAAAGGADPDQGGRGLPARAPAGDRWADPAKISPESDSPPA